MISAKQKLSHARSCHTLELECPYDRQLFYLRTEVALAHALKRTGHYDMSLRAHELALLRELRSYLQSFSAMTDLVSSKITSLSLIPLVRAEISDACQSCASEDSDELKSLKTLKANIDRRL